MTTSCHLLKNLIALPCEMQQFKNGAVALLLLDDKVVNSTIKKINSHRNILLYLLIYCLVQQCV